jgi:hypothetical protein
MTATKGMWEPSKRSVFYRDYFEFTKQSVEGKRVALVDDAVHRGSGLGEGRRYFESRGAIVDTFAFVGHEKLLRENAENYDRKMKVGKFLSAEEYKRYLLVQALYFIGSLAHFDVDC